jgi:hypothetical protein
MLMVGVKHLPKRNLLNLGSNKAVRQSLWTFAGIPSAAVSFVTQIGPMIPLISGIFAFAGAFLYSRYHLRFETGQTFGDTQ